MDWGRNRTIREYYDNGMLRIESALKGEKRNGVTRQYYQSGTLMIEANFRDGKPEGRIREFYEDGTLMAEEQYKSGHLIVQKKFDRMGRLNDVVKVFYESGRMKIEASFSSGKPDGLSREYYENGTLSGEEYYRNGILLIKKKYDTGGKLEGPVREYYDGGQLKTETDYGLGTYKEYFKSGTIKIQAAFKDGKPHGLIKEYHENGYVAGEDLYEEGRLTGSRRYSHEGTLESATGALREQKKTVTGKPAVPGMIKDEFEALTSKPVTGLEAIEEGLGKPFEEEFVIEDIEAPKEGPQKQIVEKVQEPVKGTIPAIKENIEFKMQQPVKGIMPPVKEQPKASFSELPKKMKAAAKGAFEGLLEKLVSAPVKEVKAVQPPKEKPKELVAPVVAIKQQEEIKVKEPPKVEIPFFRIEEKKPEPPVERPVELKKEKPAGKIPIISEKAEEAVEEKPAEAKKEPETKVFISDRVREMLEEKPAEHTIIENADIKEELFEQKKGDVVPAEKPVEPKNKGEEKIIKEYYKSGSLKADSAHRDGKKDGLTTEYYESGEKLAEVIYEDGAMVSQTRYDKAGNFIYKEKRR